MYYGSVQARNAAGLWGNISSGEAVTVDTAAPSAFPPLHTGAFSNSSVVRWSWNFSSDAESGIAGYMVFIGTSPGGTDIVNGSWTTEASYSFTGGTNGAVYYASVAARDRAGNQGARAVSSAGVAVDISLPSANPGVADREFTSTYYRWTWTPSEDFPSGIGGYLVSVGTSPGKEDVVKDLWTVPASCNFTNGTDGWTYYITIRAKDNAGNVGASVPGTSGITVDLTPPSANIAIEGGEAKTTSRAVMLTVWTNDTDVDEMMVGTDPGFLGISWEPFARARTIILPSGDGEKIVYVKLRDRAGHQSGAFISKITLDSTAASGGAGKEGWLSGENASLLMLVLVVAAIVLVLVVLAVSLTTRRMLVAHLKAAQVAAAIGEKQKPPKEGAAPAHKGSEATEPVKEQLAGEPVQPRVESEGWVERRPELIDGTGAAEAPEAAWTTPEETPTSMLDALAAAAREPVTGHAAGQGQAALYEPHDGDMVIRADGTEAPAPEPKLVSEWSPETGQWSPVSEETAGEAAPTLPPEPVATPDQPLIEDGAGEMAPEPTRALDDLARGFHAREAAPARPAPAHGAPPPATVPPGQRRSAKEIYDALYGKRASQPIAGAAAPAKGVQKTAEPEGQGATVPEEKKILGKARCAQCKGVIPIYSAERPLKIKCPACGLEGMIK
jgi:hypothetical protein